MKKVLSHIHCHFQKHHKKYFIGSGAVLWMVTIVKIVVLIMISIGVSFVIGKSQTSWFEEKALAVFAQLVDIAHQRDDIIHQLGKDKPWPDEKLFHDTMDTFHATDDIHGKYELAKRIEIIIEEQDTFLDKIGYQNVTGDLKFHQIKAQFYKLK